MNTVARKWWVHGRFFRWKYEIPSAPGEEIDKHFWSVRLIKPGVMGDKSNFTWMSGVGITLLTQSGSFVYDTCSFE